MEFTLRDLVYITIYVVTVTAFIVKFKEQVKAVEKSQSTTNRVIFLERGGLNVVTKGDCEKHQADLRRYTQDAMCKIHVLDKNIIRIMLSMNLEPIIMEPETIIIPKP
jgi:hypothetical protein